MTEHITALEPVDGKSTVRVRIGAESIEIGREAAATLGLAPGIIAGPELRRAIEAAGARRAAAAVALKHLRGRVRTEEEVRQVLARHGHAGEVAASVLAELRGQGLVDDERYARWFVAAREQKPMGAGRKIRELVRHGVARDLAEQAVREAGADRGAELERALAAGRSRFQQAARLGRERGLRRLHAFLVRRGFGAGVAREASLQLFANVPAVRHPSSEES
jgi:regulatory protein